jgi:hypothetical protein
MQCLKLHYNMCHCKDIRTQVPIHLPTTMNLTITPYYKNAVNTTMTQHFRLFKHSAHHSTSYGL